jgi:hypothetical protein
MNNHYSSNNVFFARHETFCPRYGWLKKGFDGVAGYKGFDGDSRIFDRDDAIEKLGVGKNMVRSIRFWCMAFKALESEDSQSSLHMSGPVRPTTFANKLFSVKGWDPYLEDPASLWLLHWKLFSRPSFVTAWEIAMNSNMVSAFSMQDLSRLFIEQRDNNEAFKKFADSSFQKDASCFIRMYAPAHGRSVSEEIECPFTSLGLLVPGDRPETWRFNLDNKTTLPDSIFLAACFEYAQMTQQSQAISLNKLTYGFNSPGVVFKLSESTIGNRLHQSIAQIDSVDFTESYGNRQLQFHESPELLYWKVLQHYYEDRHRPTK